MLLRMIVVIGAASVTVLAKTYGPPNLSKCADKGRDCCASKVWGEPPRCDSGYIPISTGPKNCPSKFKACSKINNGIGCYGCYAQSGIHDGSKCADKGSDCCASTLWGEKPACKDGYIPIATGANGCPSSYKNCKSFYNGVGCFGCYPPMKGQGGQNTKTNPVKPGGSNAGYKIIQHAKECTNNVKSFPRGSLQECANAVARDPDCGFQFERHRSNRRCSCIAPHSNCALHSDAHVDRYSVTSHKNNGIVVVHGRNLRGMDSDS